MIDCSPGAGTAAPDVRVNHVVKNRDGVQKNIKQVKYDIKNLESDCEIIRQSIEANQKKIAEHMQEYNSQRVTINDLQTKSNYLSSEYTHVTETIVRYQRMAQNTGPLANVQEIVKEINDMRNNIIQMDKDILEYRNQSILTQNIVSAQRRRTILIQKDAKLLETLNSLTVKLRVLQYAGDQKILTDSEYIIEKQLTSEELRNELEGILINKANNTDEHNSLEFSGLQVQSNSFINVNDELQNTNEYGDEQYPNDSNDLVSTMISVRERLNMYLKRDRKIDEMERSKRRKITSLQKLEVTIDKYKNDHDQWIIKRNEIAKNQSILQEQVELLKNNIHLNPATLAEILKGKKSQLHSIKIKRNQISAETKHLNIETTNAESATLKSKIAQVRDEVNALEVIKAELTQRIHTFSKLNIEDGIRDVQEWERSLKKVEGDIDTVIMRSSAVRRRKKELKKQINKTLISLTNKGITAPPYSFKAGNILDDES